MLRPRKRRHLSSATEDVADQSAGAPSAASGSATWRIPSPPLPPPPPPPRPPLAPRPSAILEATTAAFQPWWKARQLAQQWANLAAGIINAYTADQYWDMCKGIAAACWKRIVSARLRFFRRHPGLRP